MTGEKCLRTGRLILVNRLRIGVGPAANIVELEVGIRGHLNRAIDPA